MVESFSRVIAALAVASVTLTANRALAQSEGDLQQARELFGEALKDEQAQHYKDALLKFQRVEAVKDTPQVRYRIASCYEGLGRLREARDTFAAIRGHVDNEGELEVARSAADHARGLSARIPDLTVKLRGEAAGIAALEIDGTPQKPGKTLALDPGEHAIVVTGDGASQNQLRVLVAEGTHQVITLSVGKDRAVTDVSAAANASDSNNGGSKTISYVGFGVSGALLVATVISLVARDQTIGDINTECPNNACPTSKKSDVDSERDRANTLGPLAIGFAAGAVVIGGVSAYLYVRASPTTRVSLAPTPLGGMFNVVREF